MIPIRTYKQYWDSFKTRIPEIKNVFLVYTESDFAAKIRDIKANVPTLVVIVPSSDANEIDKDDIKDNSAVLVYLVCKQDNTSLTADKELDVMEVTQNILLGIRYFIHHDATTCGALLHEYLQHLNFSSLHIDPERNYLGCNGWSLSLQFTDANFFNETDYDAGALKVTITDGPLTIKKDVGESYVSQYGNIPAHVIDNGVTHDVPPGETYGCDFGPPADGEVHNSDHSISIVVPSGGSEEFPDGDLLEFDGTHTPLIAGANAVAKVPVNTIISDTDGNELLNLAPGIPGTAPDGTVTNTLGHTVITVMSGDIKQGADINVHKGDGSTIQHPLGEDYTEDPNEGSLTLGFPVDSVLSMSRTIKADEAGTYIGLTLDNCATLEIQKNTVVQNYPAVPMVLAEGDILLETITRTDPAAESSVKIFY